MNTGDVMTRNVVSIGPDASIGDAIRLMLDHRISGLPVVEGNAKLVGVLTEGDLLRRSETRTERQRPRWIEFLRGSGRLADDFVRTHARKVGEIMTDTVVTTTEEAPLSEVVELMERHRVKRLLVMRNNVLVGIVTRADLMRAVAALLSTATAPAAASNDDEIRKNVLTAFAEAAWARSAGISVAVSDGVVTLGGAIMVEKQRQALRVAAENVPGVKSVRDHIVWVEPESGTVLSAPSDDPEAGVPAG
jgi:CBS domain-containing protein